ncbi:MAG: excinuclease ABC subunit UvrB [Candidatus Nanoarchaeia archaeon]|jgi:excinuclease ABC subunit B
MNKFELVSKYKPAGSQPNAIKSIVDGFNNGKSKQTLVGVTGSGKTFTMANVIQAINKPTIVIAHNKTLAAQLYNEFKEFFPNNRVEYFVSYYDYYQPESYIPARDLYIEKDSKINPKIEQLRHAATASLMSRNDVIIVASVSCIYGLGNPKNYQEIGFEIKEQDKINRTTIIKQLIECQFERNDMELMPGRFRVKGDVIDFVPAYSEDIIRVELWGELVESIKLLDKTSGELIEKLKYFFVYPAKHFVTSSDALESVTNKIIDELAEELPLLDDLTANRLKQRTLYDVEMIRETGSCKGIENYSRHFDGRLPGEKPYCLLDYFPKDFLIIIDESHQTLPQVKGMYYGDFSRKKSLVDYGFRLKCSFDNRPLKFSEFESVLNRVMFVSATPGDYELNGSSNIVEQLIRPTGLVDPVVIVRPITGQVTDLINEVKATIKRGDRVLVTTLTKKLAEELSEYLSREGIKTRYLHSEIETLERSELIRQLRLGKFDVLVGINLLREGLDIPEVGFIGILDADKEGFLRDKRSLIQIIGRAARNPDSKVVLYADRMTDSIKAALDETNRRRSMQIAHNKQYGIKPKKIIKPIKNKEVELTDFKSVPKAELPNLIIELEAEMNESAVQMEFERAIKLRDRINQLKKSLNTLSSYPK